MKTKIIGSVFVSLMVTIGGTSAALADQVFSCVQADGSVELTSTSTGPQCELLSSGQPTKGAEVTADTVPAAAEANAEPTVEKTPVQTAIPVAAKQNSDSADDGDPKKVYRDSMIQGAQHAEGAPAAAMNPAISRRYLKVDRSTYRESIGATPVQ
jgi:hypothetical protein